MKKDIHPDYVEMKVNCACGNAFTTHGFRPELKIEVCNLCHPFFTGTMKVMDSEGRVERFNKRYRKK